jgi:serine/threonine protein kinase
VTDTTTTGAGPGPAPDDVVLGRYRLVDRVSDAAGSTLWRGYDTRLARPVSVRFMPLDHPTMPRLRDASVLASRVTDRRVVPILDIVEDAGCGRLVIVTEWITGTPLGQLLTTRGGEPLPPRRARPRGTGRPRGRGSRPPAGAAARRRGW